MPGLTAVTGAVRAAIGGYANQAVRASTEGIKNMQTLLINRNDYVRSTYITSSALSSGFSSSSF